MKPKFVKVVKITHPINWWNDEDILGKTFEVLDISEYGSVKICYSEAYLFGWIPLEVCEINPHLKLVN